MNHNEPTIKHPKSIDESRLKIIEKLENDAKINKYPISKQEVVKFIYILGKINKTKRILEIGTCIGYFAIYMATALDCHVTTVEKSQELYKIATSNIKNAHLENKITIINEDINTIFDENSKFNTFGNFDIIFIDAAKSHYLEYFKNCQKFLSQNGIIISDNVFFRNLVTSNQKTPKKFNTIVKKMKEYLEFLENNIEFETSLISIQDGVAISVKV